jgi:membrane protease YdiL (CAAX protease family)
MAGKRMDWLQFGSGKSYFHRVHRPLQCLIFIAPLLIFYQVGTFVHPWLPSQDSGDNWQVVAFLLMLKFFAFFGAVGYILPPLAVIAILFFWHLARKDPWEFSPELYAGMAAESFVWGVPFVVIGMAVLRHIPSPAAAALGPSLPWQTQVVLSVGAGIYEELLFRMIAIIVLSIIFIDVLEMKTPSAIPLIIVISAVLFAAYHLLGQESFAMGAFIFRTVMGIYLAGIYIYRGFGIAVGAHAAYDLFVVACMHGR